MRSLLKWDVNEEYFWKQSYANKFKVYIIWYHVIADQIGFDNFLSTGIICNLKNL